MPRMPIGRTAYFFNSEFLHVSAASWRSARRRSYHQSGPVDAEAKSVLFNAVPLLLLAALYLGVGLALVPSLWRDRRRLTAIDVGLGALFPCIAVPAAVFGFLVLHQREPLGGELWSAFVATVVAFVPPLVLLGRWRERALVASGMRAREAE